MKPTNESNKVQRIRMRLHKHPVKLEGTIVEFAHDGSTFVVEFDGPIPTTRFWAYSDTMVTDREPDNVSPTDATKVIAPGARVWEVL